jgi:hypothetical protein
MTDLYWLNSDLARLASEHGVNPDDFLSMEAYDEWLDSLTHLVAEKLDEEY